MMSQYEFFLASSLEKVFPHRQPAPLGADTVLSLWRGTRGSVQLVYRRQDKAEEMPRQYFTVTVSGGPGPCSLRHVRLIPSGFPCYGRTDPYYLTTAPGLFPELLEPSADGEILPLSNQYRSLWLSWDIPEDAEPGQYEITVSVTAAARRKMPSGLFFEDPAMTDFCRELRLTVRVGRHWLPAQKLIHTEWFHADCLADYYGVETFSERHWQIIESFLRSARRHGVNMLLTPVLTPPLDTPVGGIRRITQLVKIRRIGEQYVFDFSDLERWAGLAKKYGMEYLEISHFFTQWGAAFTPNILAEENGSLQRIFGWDHPADGADYRRFLKALIPALRQRLDRLGYDESHVYFHISDEPGAAHMASYRAARELVRALIPEGQIVDALSCLEFYRQGLVPHPIPGSSEIDEFHAAGVRDLWVYYCCAQCADVPNRFFSQDSARNRMMGVLMYLYDIKGFLHWGFNYYNSQYSGHPIDPFTVTDGEFGYPSGDPFLVYPGPDGEALDSLRAEVQDEGLLDLRALQYLQQLAGRQVTEAVVFQALGRSRITFTDYPHDPRCLMALREAVADAIEACPAN